MDWFGRSYINFRFQVLSTSHFVILLLFFLVTIGLFLIRDRLKRKQLHSAEYGAAIVLILIECVYHFWMFVNGSWDVSHSLPLELCNISLILTILLLLTKKKFFYEIVLFTSLLGASQAIFSPSLHYGFPHFRFFHFFFTHSIVIWVSLYFTWVKDYKPTIWSVMKVFVFLNFLLPFIMLINKISDGNYMFLSHKPEMPSLLDYLGPYPWYILSLEGLSIILCLIVWLVFREKDRDRLNISENNHNN